MHHKFAAVVRRHTFWRYHHTRDIIGRAMNAFAVKSFKAPPSVITNSPNIADVPAKILNWKFTTSGYQNRSASIELFLFLVLFTTVEQCYHEFNPDCWSFTIQSREGRSKSVASKNIDALQKLLMQYGHEKYCEIKARLGIISTYIYKILYHHLLVKKVFSRWIPYNLSKP